MFYSKISTIKANMLLTNFKRIAKNIPKNV